MFRRGLIPLFLLLVLLSPKVIGAGTPAQNWNISAAASGIAKWASDILFAQQLAIQTVVLSTREDGIFLGAGTKGGVTAGQVFEIYRAAHEGKPEEIAGRVQVAWTRDDYSFATPYGQIDLNQVTPLHFARLANVRRHSQSCRTRRRAAMRRS